MTGFVVAVLGLPFGIAGFVWEFIVRCFKAGRDFWELFER